MCTSETHKKEAHMTNNGYQHFAEALVFAHGPGALSEAIRHAEFCLKQGDTDMAAHWHATIEEVRNYKRPAPAKKVEMLVAA
jgi:hypothetical protein